MASETWIEHRICSCSRWVTSKTVSAAQSYKLYKWCVVIPQVPFPASLCQIGQWISANTWAEPNTVSAVCLFEAHTALLLPRDHRQYLQDGVPALCRTWQHCWAVITLMSQNQGCNLRRLIFAYFVVRGYGTLGNLLWSGGVIGLTGLMIYIILSLEAVCFV